MSLLRKFSDLFSSDRPAAEATSEARGFHRTMPLESILTPSPVLPIDGGDDAGSFDDGGASDAEPAPEEATDSDTTEVENSEPSDTAGDDATEAEESSETDTDSETDSETEPEAVDEDPTNDEDLGEPLAFVTEEEIDEETASEVSDSDGEPVADTEEEAVEDAIVAGGDDESENSESTEVEDSGEDSTADDGESEVVADAETADAETTNDTEGDDEDPESSEMSELTEEESPEETEASTTEDAGDSDASETGDDETIAEAGEPAEDDDDDIDAIEVDDSLESDDADTDGDESDLEEELEEIVDELLDSSAFIFDLSAIDGGVFTVGDSGEVGVDYLYDGGAYKGQLAIFSLDGLDGEEFESFDAFVAETVARAQSGSEKGHLVINDKTEGAKFSSDENSGDYRGVKLFAMKAGDTFAVMLVPDSTLEAAADGTSTSTKVRPLFSLSSANPDDELHFAQIADVTGDGSTFVLEDKSTEAGTDRDYNDVIFQVRGAVGQAEFVGNVVEGDFFETDLGKAVRAYANPYVTPVAEPVDAVEVLDVTEPDIDEGSGEVTESTETVEAEDGDTTPAEVLSAGEQPDFSELIDAALQQTDDSAEAPTPDVPADEVPEPLFEPQDVAVLEAPEIPDAPIEDQPLIGIIDTGFAADNPDIDYDNITLGTDFVNGDDNPLQAEGEGSEHGTHVLGIIAAEQDNSEGIDGINDDAPIWLGGAIGSGEWAESLIEFVNHAIDSEQPNAVVNLSLDLTQTDADGNVTTRYELTPKERAAIEYARQSNVLLVVGAGNDGGVMSALGQASQEFDNIITVGAAERVGEEFADAKAFDRAGYSSYGRGLNIVARGGTVENPVLSLTGNGVGTMAGTSVATAKVTGAISQVWAANPELSYRQVIEIVKDTATDLGVEGYDSETGAGLLNKAAAVLLAKATVPEAHFAPSSVIPDSWSGQGAYTPSERAIRYPVVPSSFSGWVMPYQGVMYRNSPKHEDRAGIAKGYQQTMYFDAWTYGERVTDFQMGTPDELWYRVSGTNYWVPSAYIFGWPNPKPAVLAPPLPATPTYSVTGDFRDVWLAAGGSSSGLLRNPTSNQFSSSGGVRQNFQGGAIIKSSRGIYTLYGGIGAHYLSNEGGEKGRLGFPTGRETGIGNGVIVQHFENGRIVYGDGPTRTEMKSSTPSNPGGGGTTNPPVTNPPVTNPPVEPVPNVPINSGSGNYRNGTLNPFAYAFQGQCTWFAYGRMLETGLLPEGAKSKALFRGHAYKWEQDARNLGLPVTSTPPQGARGLVVWPPGVQYSHPDYGHVAFIEEVYPDGRVRISEANWGGKGISERILSPAQYSGLKFVQLENARANASGIAAPGIPGQSRPYVVQPGDTLWGIAQRELGDGNRWREIMKTSTGGTFTNTEALTLQVGQTVYLPVSYETGSGTPINNNPHNSNPGSESGINWVNFSGSVGPSQGVNLRYSPRREDRSNHNEPYGKTLEFDGWKYGETVTDIWLGTPDSRWFKIKGTNYWVPSAYIWGNPPNSGSESSSGSNSSSGGNNSSSGGSTPGDSASTSSFAISISNVANASNGSSTTFRGQSIEVSGISSTSELRFYVGNKEVGGSLDFLSDGSFNAKLNIVEDMPLGYSTVTVTARTPSGELATVDSGHIINIVEDDWNQHHIGKTKGGTDRYITFERVNSPGYIENKETWIVIHGWNGKSSDFKSLSKAIEEYEYNYEWADQWGDHQVITLDWDAARTGSTSLNAAASWIETVAEHAHDVVQGWGIDSGNINLVGHSLGTYVSHEIAENFGGINNLIAFDPASSTVGGYGEKGNVDFSKYSDWSWAFHTSKAGSRSRTRTADESFRVKVDNGDIAFGIPKPGIFAPVYGPHGYGMEMWEYMLRNPNNHVGQYFGLEDMGRLKFGSSGESLLPQWSKDGAGNGSDWEARIKLRDEKLGFGTTLRPEKIEEI